MNLKDEGRTSPLGLEEFLLFYYRELDAGRSPAPAELCAAYPHLEAELKSFFSGEALLGRALPQTPSGAGQRTNPQAASPDTECLPDLGELIAEEELGRGGIGVVYRVRDDRLGRDLAVKVLRARYRDDADARQRFVEEAQISAQLQHPGVVPIHERGTLPDGRPYFTMKLIRGRTLAELLAQRLSPLDELTHWIGVFEQVCQTVGFAHGQRVLHRDLKPHNIMVGAFGEVQVMDWGLAKVLRTTPEYIADAEREQYPVRTVRSEDEATRTCTGRALGTPAYMPPEQANGRVDELDERCDVFALGAILCEILTGFPPYTGEGLKLLEQVQRGDLAEAFALLDDCGADAELVRLARCCLATDREARLRNAGAVAAAMRSYQEGLRERLQTTELERVAATARATEALRTAEAERQARRRTLALAGAVVALVCSVGLGIWFVQQRRAAVTRDLVRAVTEARTALDQGWQLRDRPERWAGALQTARLALERAEPLLEGAEAELRASVVELRRQFVEAERAQVLLAAVEKARGEMAHSTGGHWNFQAFATGCQAAFAAAGFSLDDEPATLAAWVQAHPLREQVLDALEGWELVCTEPAKRNRLRAVIDAAEPEATALRRRIRVAHAKGDVGALRELARSDEAQRLTPAAIFNLANYLNALVHPDAGRDAKGAIDPRLLAVSKQTHHFHGRPEAIALVRRGIVRHPDDFWLHVWLASILDPNDEGERTDMLCHATAALALRPASSFAHHMLGAVLAAADRPGEARVALRRALELDADNVGAAFNLAWLHIGDSDVEGGRALLQSAVEKAPGYASAHYALGYSLYLLGRLDEALTAFNRAVALEPLNGIHHVGVGLILMQRQDRRGARLALDKACRLAPNSLDALALSAELYREGHDLDSALALFQRAAALPNQRDHRKLAEVHHGLGRVLAMKGDAAAAVVALRNAAQLDPHSPTIRASLGRLTAQNLAERKAVVAALGKEVQANPDNERLLLMLGDACLDTDDTAGAIDAYRRCTQLAPKNVVALVKLGHALTKRPDLAEALTVLRRAVELDEGYAPSHIFLARVLLGQNDRAGALASVRKGLDITPQHPEGLVVLTEILEGTNQTKESVEAYRKALAVQPGNVALHLGLGRALLHKQELSAALAAFRKAAELAPDNAEAHYGMGLALVNMQDLDGGLAALRKSVAQDASSKGLWALYRVLSGKGEWRAAEGTLREILKTEPAAALAIHCERANCLLGAGDLDGAGRAARAAIRAAPNAPQGYDALGVVLAWGWNEEEAIAQYRRAAELGLQRPELSISLGLSLHALGRYAEARKAFRQGQERAVPESAEDQFCTARVAYLDKLLKLQPRFVALVQQRELPTDPEELLALADLCSKGDKRHYVAAVRCYRAAFAAQQWSFRERDDTRLQAAVAAVQAAAGRGEGAAGLDDKERTRLRTQALTWLKADLEDLRRALEATGPSLQPRLLLPLRRSLSCPGLAPVVDAQEADKLSEEERRAWKQYRTEATALLDKRGVK